MVVLVVLAILLGVATFVYAFFRYHELDRTHVTGLVSARAGAAFDVLVVGTSPVGASNSRAHNSGASSSKLTASVILLARIDPQTHEIRMIAVPPQTEVAVANPAGGASSTLPIADTLETGPGTLVRTITSDFDVPVTDYLSLKAAGVGPIVSALGGIHLDFAYPVRDAFTGLSVNKSGCQRVSGSQAQSLFDSRHLYYFARGAWRADLGGTSSAMGRENSVFAATVTSSGGIGFDPVELNNLVSSAVANLTIDNGISEGKLLSLAETFRGFSRAQLAPVAFPVIEARTRDDRGIAVPDPHADDAVLARFLSLGTTSSVPEMLHDIHVGLPPGVSVSSGAPVIDKPTPAPWNPTTC
ncbi:MAG: LCP family protein [Acidimicrobiales bacterium]